MTFNDTEHKAEVKRTITYKQYTRRVLIQVSHMSTLVRTRIIAYLHKNSIETLLGQVRKPPQKKTTDIILLSASSVLIFALILAQVQVVQVAYLNEYR